ncbi:MAG: hypothetical protein ABEI57_02990 [Halapricum sp.]
MDRSHRLVIFVGLLVIVCAGFVGGQVTYATFLDRGNATGSVSAAASFNGQRPSGYAYDDANGNGRWDPGEPTYTEQQLYSFDDPSASLVIPSDVGVVNNSNGISITAGNITAETDFQSNWGSVSLTATRGAIDVTGQQLIAFSRVDVSGQSVSGSRANIGSLGSVTLSARENGGGPLDASGASVTSLFGNVTLRSNGDISLNNAEVNASQYGSISASLQGGSPTLSVGGASLSDQDDTLVYTPAGIKTTGHPSSGSITEG